MRTQTIFLHARERPSWLFGGLAIVCLLMAIATWLLARSLGETGFFALWGGLFALVAALPLKRRELDVYPDQGLFVVRDRWWLFQKTRRYKSDRFASVASYFEPGRPGYFNCLALLAPNGRDGLLLWRVLPPMARSGFGGVPLRHENAELVAVREVVALALGLADGGCLGQRGTGPQLRADG